MRITSSNPALVLIAPNATTAGSAFIDVPLTAPSTYATFTLQALEGVTGDATITVTAPGFTPTTSTVTVRGLGVDLISFPATTTSLSPNSVVYARIGMLDAAGTSIETEAALRTGGVPLTVTVTNSTATVGQLVTTSSTGQSASATISVGQSRIPYGVVAGGIEFDPLSSGTTTLRASIPGVTSVSAATQTVTVTAPSISTPGGAILGAGLQAGTYAILGASDFGTATVRITSSNPALVLIAPNATTAGSAFIDVSMSAPSSSVGYFVQALDGVTGTATITVAAAGFVTGTATVTVRGLGVELISVPTSTTAASPNNPFQARIGTLDATGTSIESEYARRAGGASFTVTVTNSNSAVAQLVTNSLTGQSVTTLIVAGQTRSPSVANGGVEVDPLASGSTTLSATIPGATALPGATRTVTVTP